MSSDALHQRVDFDSPENQKIYTPERTVPRVTVFDKPDTDHKFEYKPGERQAVIWCEACEQYHQEGQHTKLLKPERIQVLQEREKTHGNFLMVAKVAQDIKNALRWAPKEQPVVVVEASELISTKLARAIIGNCLEPEHWLDIQGYAGLVLEYIEFQKNP